MEREKETYGGKMEELTAVHQKAAGPDHRITQQNEIFQPSSGMTDAQLSFAGGYGVVGPGAPNDAPISPDARAACALPFEAIPAQPPKVLLGLQSAPDCSEGNWNMEKIARGGK